MPQQIDLEMELPGSARDLTREVLVNAVNEGSADAARAARRAKQERLPVDEHRSGIFVSDANEGSAVAARTAKRAGPSAGGEERSRLGRSVAAVRGGAV